MNNLTEEIDALFGFPSTWTFDCGSGCWEQGGAINIDDDEIAQILKDGNVEADQRELVKRFLMGHEKGHYLQEFVWHKRDYGTEHHVMEIEADLIGAWTLAHLNKQRLDDSLIEFVKRFDDANTIAQKLGMSLGDHDEDTPHHPWAEQRELAIVRGPEIAILYSEALTDETRKHFATEMRDVAGGIKGRGL